MVGLIVFGVPAVVLRMGYGLITWAGCCMIAIDLVPLVLLVVVLCL